MNNLGWFIFMAATSTLTGFIYYWVGVGVAERMAARREARLLQQLDAAVEVITDLARDPRKLRVVK